MDEKDDDEQQEVGAKIEGNSGQGQVGRNKDK